MKVWLDHEELWEPWELSAEPRGEGPGKYDGPYEAPDDLIDRFEKAKAEIEAIWLEIQAIVNAEDWKYG